MPSQRPRRWFLASALSFVAGTAIAVLGCASPTLPLPPPSTPDIAPAADGMWKLSSKAGVEGYAIVVLFNRNTSLPAQDRVDGTQADAEGSWEETIKATPGDVIEVTQEFGATRSSATTFRIPQRAP